ncbi:hypothetical protein [Aliivibrio sp. EL58]|uniref:hypothetical protein n=1 Tax=Aliivibrio sp. EL58 TaxID=2107582 RepID=UPI0013C527E1|nr:hypothetical protein [Aliivibrio sp. EL58]
MKKIIILVHDGFFTQHLHEYQNIDLSVVEEALKRFDCEVKYLEYQDLANYNYQVDENAVYWCGSHQNISIKQYINDVLTARFYNRNNLVPSLDTVLAHENKGLMGILAAEKMLPYIKQNYRLADKISLPQQVSYPFVFKSLGGAGSKGVSLVKNQKQFLQSIKCTLRLDRSLKEVKEDARNIARKLLKRGEQARYLTQRAKFCEQEFIPELSSDYKVLVFWEKVFVLKRSVREGDFRASGSGCFEIQSTIDNVLAELAISCREKLSVPYCSLDFVTLPSGEYKLIEFQTCHFGPYTQISSEVFFRAGNIWGNTSSCVFESELVESMLSYVNETSI